MIEQEDVDKMVTWLKARGENIRTQAQAGCTVCNNIINVYGMFYKFPESGSFGILQGLMSLYTDKYEGN